MMRQRYFQFSHFLLIFALEKYYVKKEDSNMCSLTKKK